MAVSSLVAAAGGKTPRKISLTSGTSWTVPAEVTFVNVTLIGGGGGGAGGMGSSGAGAQGGTGGTTTFTGATSAVGGIGNRAGVRNQGGTNMTGFAQGTNATNNTGEGGVDAMSHVAQSSGLEGTPGKSTAPSGQTISSTVITTPGSSISYSIGGGGAGGAAGSGTGGQVGGDGGSGRIDIEYWV
jgi:hypothetical protein